MSLTPGTPSSRRRTRRRDPARSACASRPLWLAAALGEHRRTPCSTRLPGLRPCSHSVSPSPGQCTLIANGRVMPARLATVGTPAFGDSRQLPPSLSAEWRLSALRGSATALCLCAPRPGNRSSRPSRSPTTGYSQRTSTRFLLDHSHRIYMPPERSQRWRHTTQWRPRSP